MTEENLKRMKSLIRAVLMSSKDGVATSRLLGDYREFAGEQLPYKEMGFPSVARFIESIPDVARLQTDRTGEEIIHAIADESTAHIQKMISKQKSTRRTKALPRGPHRRPLRPVRSGRPRGPTSYGYSNRPWYNISRPFSRPRSAGRAISPLLQTPTHSGGFSSEATDVKPGYEKTSHSGVFSSNNDSFQNIQITVGGNKGCRLVSTESTRKIFDKALSDASGDRRRNTSTGHSESKYGHNFEVPPRFQKKEKTSSENKPVAANQELSDPREYLDLLEEYSQIHNISVSVDTKESRLGVVTGYLGMVQINDKSIDNVDIFETPLAAREQAAKKTCLQMDITRENLYNIKPTLPAASSSATSITVPDNIKKNIKKILNGVAVSLWSTRLPVLYKETFGSPPDNLMEMAKACPDIAKFETVPHANREMIYPVKTEEIPAPIVNLLQDVIIPVAESMTTGCDVTVYVTYAMSCEEFYVQLETSCFNEINQILQAECTNLPKPDPSVIQKGIYCSALYSKDEQWYRAEAVSDVNNKEIRVRFVDYGNIDTVSLDNIRQLPTNVVTFSQQAIVCSLYGIKPVGEAEWSKASLQIFAEFVRDQALTAVTQSQTDGCFDVELYRGENKDTCINQILIDQNEALSSFPSVEPISVGEPELLELPDEKFIDVYISFLNPSSVMVRIVGDQFSDKLEDLESELENYYKSTRDYNQPINVGMVYCVCLDSLYNRVKVLSTDGEKVECYFLDHGDTDIIAKKYLKTIDVNLNKTLPYQAFSIELYGLENELHNSTTLEQLYELALAKICVAEIISRDDKITSVLYDTQGQDDININEYIAKVLISEGHTLDLNIFTDNIGPSTMSDALSVGSNDSASGVAQTEIPKNIVTPFESKLSKSTDSLNPLPINFDNLSIVKSVEDTPEESVICTGANSSSIYTWEKTNPDRTSAPTTEEVKPVSVIYNASSETPSVLPMPVFAEIPAVDETFAIHVLWVIDPSNFVCLPYHHVEQLEKFMVELNDYFSKAVLEEVEPVVEMLYAGIYNGTWYRIIVKNIIESELGVYIPDYGEHTILTSDDLQPLPKQFYNLPFTAFKAKLHDAKWYYDRGMTFDGENWSQEAIKAFVEIAQGRCFYSVIRDKEDNGMVSLTLIDTSHENDDVCVDDMLVTMNFARRQ